MVPAGLPCSVLTYRNKKWQLMKNVAPAICVKMTAASMYTPNKWRIEWQNSLRTSKGFIWAVTRTYVMLAINRLQEIQKIQITTLGGSRNPNLQKTCVD